MWKRGGGVDVAGGFSLHSTRKMERPRVVTPLGQVSQDIKRRWSFRNGGRLAVVERESDGIESVGI